MDFKTCIFNIKYFLKLTYPANLTKQVFYLFPSTCLPHMDCTICRIAFPCFLTMGQKNNCQSYTPRTINKTNPHPNQQQALIYFDFLSKDTQLGTWQYARIRLLARSLSHTHTNVMWSECVCTYCCTSSAWIDVNTNFPTDVAASCSMKPPIDVCLTNQ